MARDLLIAFLIHLFAYVIVIISFFQNRLLLGISFAFALFVIAAIMTINWVRSDAVNRDFSQHPDFSNDITWPLAVAIGFLVGYQPGFVIAVIYHLTKPAAGEGPPNIEEGPKRPLRGSSGVSVAVVSLIGIILVYSFFRGAMLIGFLVVISTLVLYYLFEIRGIL
jgi:hypothetical protein